jgi:RNA polymerase sigma factor (sigma-70 family)
LGLQQRKEWHMDAEANPCLGDRRATLEAVVGDSGPELRSFARRLVWGTLGGLMEPEDLLQEALLEAWIRIDSFEGTTVRVLRDWLEGILWHQAENHRRHHLCKKRDCRRALLVGELFDLPETAGDGPDQVERLETAERIEALRSVLATLREPGRTVIRLVKLEGRRPREAAAILSMNLWTVHTILARAMVELKAKLRRHRAFKDWLETA